jgi:hypothetical protein
MDEPQVVKTAAPVGRIATGRGVSFRSVRCYQGNRPTSIKILGLADRLFFR